MTVRASPPPVTPCVTPGWTSPCISPISAARPVTSPAKVRRAALGAVRGRPVSRSPPNPRSRLLRRRRRAARSQPRVPVGRAQAPQALIPHAARARRGRALARMSFPVRAKPFVTPIAAAGSRQCPARHARVDGPERPSGRNASPSGITQSTDHVAGPGANPRAADRGRPGRPRAQHPYHQPRARTTSPPQFQPRHHPDPALDTWPLHK